jgi:hypothetical protein
MSYDYGDSGFDAFLSRSIDSVSQVNLDSTGPVSTSRAFDRGQNTGSIGDILRVGKFLINGVSGRISIYDDNGNEVARIGELDD